MNYANLSDFEINKLVAENIGLSMDGGYGFVDADGNLVCYDVISELGGETKAVEVRVNYCNNPSDAWPIITENEIDLINNGLGCTIATDNTTGLIEMEDVNFYQDKNPLRAAMIVFLMMQESSK